MTAITGLLAPSGEFTKVRTATAQASTGQTDWYSIPNVYSHATFFFELTAVAGTTPIFLPSLRVPGPITLDTGTAVNLAEHAALTGLTQAGFLVIEAGPGLTGIANDVTNSATAASYVQLNCNLPPILGITILNDRTTGDETYTYTIGMWLKKGR